MQHVDTFIDKSEQRIEERRKAEITQTEDHGVAGVPVFFSAEHLERLGIDVNDTTHIVVRVEDEFILFEPFHPSE